MVRRVLTIVLAVTASGCVSLQAEQRERIAAYKANRSRDFVTQFAESKVDPRQADLLAIVTAEAINAPLKRFDKQVFPAGNWEFVPTSPPVVEINTGGALVRIEGELRQKVGGTQADVTIVGGLAVRWNDDGSHLYLKPSALAVVPRLKVGFFQLALGRFLRQFAETQAQQYLDERVGEIDVPVKLILPIHRPAVTFDYPLRLDDPDGAVLRMQLPEATAQVQLQQLYVWPVEGRLIVLAFADVAKVTPIPTGKAP